MPRSGRLLAVSDIDTLHGSIGDLRAKGMKPSPIHLMATLSRSRPDLLSPPPSPGIDKKVSSMSTIPHEGLSPKNELWISIQTAIMGLFQGRKLEDGQMAKILENIRNMMKTDVGPFIYEYFKNQLLKRGLVIMRESLKRLEYDRLLEALGNLWRRFFREILPVLQVLLRPIQTTEFSIRDVSLLTFRDVIVLKLSPELTEALENTLEISPPVRQMLLVLQGVYEGFPPSDNRLKLEGLVGLAVNPYIGYKGIYYGASEPKIKACEDAYRKKSSITKPIIPPQLPYRQMSIDVGVHLQPALKLSPKLGHIRQGSIPNIKLHSPLLKEIMASETARRFSYDDVVQNT